MLLNLRFAAATAAMMLTAACASTGARTASTSGNPDASAAKPVCVTQSASRIPRTAADCDGFGRVYSSDDISRTGEATAGGALRLLDPRLTIGP